MNEDTKKPIGRPKADKTASKLLQIRVEPKQHQAYKEAAKTKDMSVSAWAKEILDKASM